LKTPQDFGVSRDQPQPGSFRCGRACEGTSLGTRLHYCKLVIAIKTIISLLFSQTGLTYFYKWPIPCEIQILNLIKCGSGICNRCDQRLFLLASRFSRLAKSLWNQGSITTVSIGSRRLILNVSICYMSRRLCYIFTNRWKKLIEIITISRIGNFIKICLPEKARGLYILCVIYQHNNMKYFISWSWSSWRKTTALTPMSVFSLSIWSPISAYNGEITITIVSVHTAEIFLFLELIHSNMEGKSWYIKHLTSLPFTIWRTASFCSLNLSIICFCKCKIYCFL
jgi:hypothetical protein